jgi:hypothetical protein
VTHKAGRPRCAAARRTDEYGAGFALLDIPRLKPPDALPEASRWRPIGNRWGAEGLVAHDKTEIATMADKLTEKSWKAFTAQHKIDGADVSKRLSTYTAHSTDEHADRLDALAELVKSLDKVVAAVKKDKALAANKEVAKQLDAMKKEAAGERKAIEVAKVKFERDGAKSGLRKVDVQIIARGWNDEPMRGYKIYAEFKAPGFAAVTLAQDIKGGVAQYNDAMIMPAGSVRVMAVSTSKATLAPEKTISFKLPKGDIMVLTADQEHEEYKVRASSVEEASKKSGLKGEAGIDWKIFSAGVEKSSESETKSGSGVEVEWTVKAGLGSFKLEQTK